ncbi:MULTISPECIES: hypothetical protein [unclassified Paracoccus (in: a-proteobacteria)]|uniref:hypothetical protein n=1 Tax=unclassified Paracoccus (in: a-proteobacteria) TaxID=2688777 RepID=UPI0012B1A06E|nr:MULTISPECIES: hypothetical protein [unclassified Paracoccus (in: a-proteobacteria)]UXU76014.1 hypothetical protein GB879_005910 [Paracoccus sp. SMMA_5]UXU81924.1 hypothetical protein GB880_005895 [Paracoccus sp. SMMA_5_TC]
MIDILLLAGVALAVLSVVMAVVSLARTQPPRGAALALVLGIALMFAGSWLGQRPFSLQTLGDSWQRLLSGQISLDQDATPVAPVPASAPQAAAEAPAETPAEPAAAEPSADAPAATPVQQ